MLPLLFDETNPFLTFMRITICVSVLFVFFSPLLCLSSQLFSDTDVFQQYGIPMNPTDSTTPATLAGIADKSTNQSENQISGSELISYQPNATPIDFTEFLNIDDEQSLMTVNGEVLCKNI